MKVLSKLFLVLFVLSGFFMACGDAGTTDPMSTETGSVNFKISVKQQTRSTRAVVNLGTLVTKGVIRLQRGALVKYVNLAISGTQATAQVDNLLVGRWDVQVQLYDNDGNVLYSGSSSFIVANQQTTQNIEIVLTRHEGSALFIIDLPTETNEIPGLVFWNKLGSAAEVGASVAGPNMTLYGAPAFSAGKFGNGMTCNAISDYAAVSGVEDVRSRGTVEMWIAPQFDSNGTGITELYPTFFQSSPWVTPPNLQVMDIGYQNNASGATYQCMTFTICYTDGGGAQQYAKATSDKLTFSADQWMHIAAVWDVSGIDGTTDTMRLYINGVVAGRSSVAFVAHEKTSFEFGRNSVPTRSAHSKLDNIKIYNYAKVTFDLMNE